MGVGKPRGIQAARKLKNRRRLQKWNDLNWRSSHVNTMWKKPFARATHATGIVVEKLGIEAKQPNSAIRKAVRVQLKKNGKKITAFVPYDGGITFINENDDVLVAGLGRRGQTVGDRPGVRFKVVKVKGKSLHALYTGKQEITR